jgi:hypothetical protein
VLRDADLGTAYRWGITLNEPLDDDQACAWDKEKLGAWVRTAGRKRWGLVFLVTTTRRQAL